MRVRKNYIYISLLLVINIPAINAQLEMADDLNEALTFTKYPTYPQYVAMMEYFAAEFPDICRLDTIGVSANGRLILAMKISDNVNTEEDEPAFFYTSTMHGDELAGYVLTLRLIDFLVNNYGLNVEVDRVIDDLEIWINPHSNPDATYRNGDTQIIDPSRYTPEGRDLNRTFPNVKTGTDDTTGLPIENQQMMLFMRERQFNLSANIHGGAEVVNYPWDHAYSTNFHKRHPDNDWFVFISQEYADVARDVDIDFMSLFVDDSTGITGITHGADWYPVSNGRQDYVTYFLKGREVTLELHNNKELPASLLEEYWNINQWSMINYMMQARYGIHGNITDATTGEGIEARIFLLGHDNDSSWITSDPGTGNFYRYLKEGIYDLEITAEGYIGDTVSNVDVYDFQKTELVHQLIPVGTGLSDPLQENTLNIYPNPATDILVLSFSQSPQHDSRGAIYNSLGAAVQKIDLPPGERTGRLDISALESGLYLLQLISGDLQFSRIIVIQ